MPTVSLKHLFATGLAAALLGGCSPGGDAVGGNAAHGQAIAKARCAACHGADGNSTMAIYPRLASQNADYLYRQLVAYRDGTRTSAVMFPVVKPLSDQDLKDVVVFFAGRARGSDPPGPQVLMAEGRRLFRSGSLGVPACAACHAPGARGMGNRHGLMGMGRMHGMSGMMGMRSAGAPTLYGQHAAYVMAQLHAFADGSRPSLVMSPIANIMTARQQQAVADYLAAHP